MSSPNPNPPPAQPHHHLHSPRYYARRVKESLPAQVTNLLCYLFLGLLLLAGVITFVVWLSIRPHRPRFHVSTFSVPGLSQENGFQNADISFDVTDRNPNQNVGIHYDDMSGSVFYRELRIGKTPLLLPFYQPPKNTTLIHGVFAGASLTVGDSSWREFMLDRNAGKVVFRLELRARIRFRVTTFESGRHHRLHVSCDVAVGPDGEVTAASKHKRCSLYFT